MSLPKKLLVCLALLITAPAFAGPVLRIEAGYAQFDLEHQIDEIQNLGGLVVEHHKDNFESGNAFHVAAEAGWSASEHLEWIAGLAAVYSADAQKENDISLFSPGLTWTVVNEPDALDEMYTFSLRGGLRWQQNLSQNLRLHADAAVSLNQWRYSYSEEVIDILIDPNTSQITQFVLVNRTFTDDDRFLALDTVLGLYYAFTPKLDAVLDASGQLGEDYRNIQYNAGLRYSFR